MSGVLALVGSGEFTDLLNEADRFLLLNLKNPRVAILPTAAGGEKGVLKWIDDGVSHFKKLGANVSGVELINRQSANNSEIVKELQNFNFFYFSGGNPRYLLDVLKGSLAWNVILKRYKDGATLVGSSAGAMVLGKKVWADVYQYIEGKHLLPWVDGLGVVDFGIIPHFDTLQKEFSKNEIDEIQSQIPDSIPIIGIDENTAYICRKDAWKVIGKGNVHDIQKKSM